MKKEKHVRSIIKTFTWRFIATLTTSFVAFFLTHKWEVALSIGGIDGILKLIFYYFHERAWDHITWGTKKHASNTATITFSKKLQ